jgi:hypothetical protein
MRLDIAHGAATPAPRASADSIVSKTRRLAPEQQRYNTDRSNIMRICPAYANVPARFIRIIPYWL